MLGFLENLYHFLSKSTLGWIRYFWSFISRDKRLTRLTHEEISEKARKMLNDWKVDRYAENKFLYTIPSWRSSEKYKEFVDKLTKENST